MESELTYILNLGLLLLFANIGGMISKKLKQPAVLGQILMGILLSMTFFEETELVSQLGEIGVIFLMFIAGLETDVQELKESGKSSSLIAIGGVVAPSLLVFGGMYFVTGDVILAAFMGLISTATSVSISVQTLREIGKLRTKQGITILGAAIIDDVIGIILLTLMVGVVKPTEGAGIAIVLAQIAGFFLLTYIVGRVITLLLEKFGHLSSVEDKIVTYAIVVCFIMAFISEELGVAAITGAYFSGVVFSMTTYRHKVSHEINRIATLMFTPLFFLSIGMSIDIFSAASALGIGMLFIVLGFIGKILGAGLGATMTGFQKREALQIGLGMVPRAEVALIMANLGLKMEIISHHEMAAVILMVIVTTLVTPSLLKMSFETEPKVGLAERP